MLRTFRGWIRKDGRVELEEDRIPDHDAPVLVTFLEDDFEGERARLTALGDYASDLSDYEDRLARGEVEWH